MKWGRATVSQYRPGGLPSGWYVPGIADPAEVLELSPFEEATGLNGSDFGELLTDLADEKTTDDIQSTVTDQNISPSYVSEIPDEVTKFIESYGLRLPESETSIMLWGMAHAYYLGQKAVISQSSPISI